MGDVIECPSCSRKLRRPAEQLGQRVTCPACGTTFAPGTGAETLPARAPVMLELEIGDDSPALPGTIRGVPPPPAPLRPVMLESTELPPDPEDQERRTQRCPECGERQPRGIRRCTGCGARLGSEDREEDRPWMRDPRLRRDTEPHRGTLILILGIVSLALMFLPIVGLPLGIAAWVMGHSDLKKMRAHEMDADGMGITQAGQICGILGTVLNAFMVCGFGATILPAILEDLF